MGGSGRKEVLIIKDATGIKDAFTARQGLFCPFFTSFSVEGSQSRGQTAVFYIIIYKVLT